MPRLTGHFDRKVHLVVGGHSAHRSRKVRDWLTDHPGLIELHFLPSYSPELNPDELVNADLKRSLPMHSRAATRPNSPPRPAGSSTAANGSHTSSAATSSAHTSATPSNRTL
ncbi:transposase [Streptomyces europaeiscabiei]